MLVDTAIVGHLGTVQPAAMAIAAPVLSTGFAVLNFLTLRHDGGWGIEDVWWGLAGLIGMRALTCGLRSWARDGFSPAPRRNTLAARMLCRTVIIVLILALLAPAAAAAQTQPTQPQPTQPQPTQPQPTQPQQQPTQPFSPLPPAQPTPAPTPEPEDDGFLDSEISGTSTLYVIAGALLVAFIAIGMFISRDARKALPAGHRPDARRLRDEGPHQHKREAKARARAKGKAQKAARRRNR